MQKRNKLAPLALAALVLAPSCSLMVPATQSISIVATDPSADIYVDGNLVGRGSATARVRRDESHGITARVDERVGVANVGTSVSSVGMLDIIGGFLFLIPFIGVVAPGFHELDQTTVTVVVPPSTR